MPIQFLPFLAPIATFFGGLIFARNTDKSTKTSKEIALHQSDSQKELEVQRQQTQLKLAYLNIESQAQLEKRRQGFQLESQERQQQFQKDLTYLNIEAQAQLAKRRQEFDLGLQERQHQFQERMEYLRFGQQVTLEKAKQEFQFRFNALQFEQQKEIQTFIQNVQLAINQKNLDFQRWRFEQETILQQQLAEYNRQTQLLVAHYQRETALKLPEANKLFENWPLRIVPAQILNSHHEDTVIPLRIIISPPSVEFDKFEHTEKQNFPKIEKRLAEGLRQLLNQHYPLQSPTRPTELLDGAWDSGRFHGGTSIKGLFSLLQSEPTLVLESEVDSDYLNFRLAYWGVGQSNYQYDSLISKLPYRDILFASAKQRALQWKTEVRDKLVDKGMNLKEINEHYDHTQLHGAYNATNLAVLEEEEKFAKLGIPISRQYRLEPKDWEALCQILEIYHCVVTGVMADIHHLIHNHASLLLPSLLPQLLKNEVLLSTESLVQWVIASYQEIFNLLTAERGYQIPEWTLQLAEGLVKWGDKRWAWDLVKDSLTIHLQQHGIIPPDKTAHIEAFLTAMKPTLSAANRSYVKRIGDCLAMLH
ncbi:MAG: hypothetical protein BWK78_05960 [Thiotrichaceae bacterium IS1]|nr:MAG: hypothetical protein BWK78_05960 [Thiotrichaceae bacterium IS1]